MLEQKLVEFHGVFEDAQLPSKKTFVQKSRAFLETQRESFEQYLQVSRVYCKFEADFFLNTVKKLHVVNPFAPAIHLTSML